MRLENIIMWDGERTDGEANKTPSEEKQKEADNMPKSKDKMFRL